jgi:hypothetical protein
MQIGVQKDTYDVYLLLTTNDPLLHNLRINFTCSSGILQTATPTAQVDVTPANLTILNLA